MLYITIPLFQLCSFLTSTFPLGLNGPFSENAPTPNEEQPGPTTKYRKKISFLTQNQKINKCPKIF